MAERTPAEGIADHRQRLDSMSDEEFLALLRETPPLPQEDDDDPIWDQDSTWDRAELLIAFAGAIGDRRLVTAIRPLYERASLSDAFEMMEGLRHGPERAVAPDWSVLAEIMVSLVDYPLPGCRRWAVRELGILREQTTTPNLLRALVDTEPEVRAEACGSLSMMTQTCDDGTRAAIISALARVAADDPSEEVRAAAAWAAERSAAS